MKTGGLIIWLTVIIVVVLQLFLPFIVPFLYAEKVDLLPIRLYLLAPLFWKSVVIYLQICLLLRAITNMCYTV